VVLAEVDDSVFAGDVGGGDEGEFVPGDRGVEGDKGDAAARNGAADRGAEPHAGQGDVVNILGATEHLCRSLFAEGRLADDLGSGGHEGRVKNRTKAARCEVLL
jgi:hypothetical protein